MAVALQFHAVLDAGKPRFHSGPDFDDASLLRFPEAYGTLIVACTIENKSAATSIAALSFSFVQLHISSRQYSGILYG